MARSLVSGLGVNDADYVTSPQINGKQKHCKIYNMWKAMLQRCYDRKLKERFPTYDNCVCSDDWLKFSAFKDWVATREWQGKQLDKDIIKPGNKIYSADTCAFVDATTNVFVNDCKARRGDFLIGVISDCGRFRARCRNPFTKKLESLGYYDAELEAHLAWKRRKHELACQLADLQTDERVANALRTRYL